MSTPNPHIAELIVLHLEHHGAASLPDLYRELKLPSETLRVALWSLAHTGRVWRDPCEYWHLGVEAGR